MRKGQIKEGKANGGVQVKMTSAGEHRGEHRGGLVQRGNGRPTNNAKIKKRTRPAAWAEVLRGGGWDGQWGKGEGSCGKKMGGCCRGGGRGEKTTERIEEASRLRGRGEEEERPGSVGVPRLKSPG